MNFEDLKINSELINALEKDSISIPTEIQKETIPQLIEGNDLVIVSETGTGKTLAYVLPLLQKIDLSINNNQAIILAPTHELASQINKEINNLSMNADLKIKSLLAIGEASIKRQIEALKKKPQIIVGSPGRVHDLIKQKKIKTHTIKTIIIDEADILIVGEHSKTIETIINSTMQERQLLFVSATMGNKSQTFIKTLSPKVKDITIVNSGVISENIEHIFIHSSDIRNKINILRKAIHGLKPEKAIIFVKTNIDVADLGERLRHHKIQAIEIRGDNRKLDRQKAFNDFKTGKEKILISSDIGARGLDVQNVSHIFNYNIPEASGDYKHRVGRTGRSGKKGIAVSITSGNEKRKLQKFADELKITISEKMLKEGELTNIEKK